MRAFRFVSFFQVFDRKKEDSNDNDDEGREIIIVQHYSSSSSSNNHNHNNKFKLQTRMGRQIKGQTADTYFSFSL